MMFKNIVKVHYTTELEEKIKQEMKNISERNRQIYLSCPEKGSMFAEAARINQGRLAALEWVLLIGKEGQE